MRHSGMGKIAISLLFLGVAVAAVNTPTVHGAPEYRLGAFPFYSQEGSNILLVFIVSGAAPNTYYEFDFYVRDPTTTWWKSNTHNYTTLPGETEFAIIISYPSPEFPSGASTNLVGIYLVAVNQNVPIPTTNPVATTFFYVGLTDKTGYQRTETVGIFATGYQPGESVTVNIRTEFTSTVVYNHNTTASPSGQVSDSWYIPRSAVTNEAYVLTLTGTSTSKSPADAQGFNIGPAIISISSISSSQSTYQRTETFSFSFQATYPSGEIANTGLGLVTLRRPDGGTRTLTTSYNSTTQMFVATYKTTPTNQTGTWNATLAPWAFDDSYGNIGPLFPVSTLPQLVPATLSVTLTMKTSFAFPGEPLKFNATAQYPDGSFLTSTSGTVSATFAYSGGGYSRTFSAIYDTTLSLWVGTYIPAGDEPSGLWSLNVTASDSASPANTGNAVRAVTVLNRAPTPAFTASSNNVQTGVSVSFNATASSDPDGTIVSYLWSFGDGSTGSGITVSHSFSNSGTYLVRLNITDNGGAAATSTTTMTIQNRPPTATITGPSPTVPVGSSVSFDGTTSTDSDGTIVGYLWDFGDSSPTVTGPTASHAYTTPGTYTARLTVTDDDGAVGTTTYSITAQNQTPSATITGASATAQLGSSVSFDATTSKDPDGTIVSYLWDFGDGSPTTTGATTSHSYVTPGTYTVRLTVTDDDGAIGTTTYSVTVAAPASTGILSLPLYYFAIFAALIGTGLGGVFLARRHKVTHARLKIDLDAVRSEAGRIENQEFFQSVKDQLKKDKDD